ncbi:MAG: primosomal protein N' [Bacteroidetes bacterium]|nr:MAG: primosomal protein N' [Bacteroidota bacterium]
MAFIFGHAIMSNAPTLLPYDTYTHYADVIVPLYLPKTLTWALPQAWLELVRPGCRVEVQVGPSKRYAGIVKRIHQQKPNFAEVKPILGLLDDEPVLFPQQLQLWAWIAEYYLCSEGEIMIAALPIHLKLSSESIVQFNPDHGIELTTLSDREYLVAEALEIKQELKLGEIQKILDTTHVMPIVKRLLEKQVCFVWENLSETYKEKKETYVHLSPQYQAEAALESLINSWSKAPKQLDLLLTFLHFQKTKGQVAKAELLKKSGATASVLDGLVDKQVLLLEKRAVDRLPLLPRHISLNFELSHAQQLALQQVEAAFAAQKVCLLHGVTGSGKTMVYIHLMAAMVRQGKQCLFLLPEIALTAQIIRKLRQHLGGHVAVYHSKFNPSERLELWNKIKSGEVQVVVGARSALFLPFGNLGLIIADEEHDGSYKQHDPSPRYHARDAAVYYGLLCKANVLLGSATPSVETYYNATSGKYALVGLNERFGGLELPRIDLIDLKRIPATDGERIIISPPLLQAIEETLAAKKQIIVFLNRRGYTPYQVCNSCGWIPKCKHCDVSLNYHKSTAKLHCHYCGTTYAPAKACSNCGSQDFKQQTYGTEKLEETLETLLPHAKVARMDTDSVRGKHSHDLLIKDFEQQKIQILTGTQMVVKGLDFDNVGLVAIPDTDGLLHYADFRVNERAFQLIEQVSGRAGRKLAVGNVLLQLRETNHPLIAMLQRHDYAAFFSAEIANRRAFAYPPFSRLISVQCRHLDRSVAHQSAYFLTDWMKAKNMGNHLVGPAEPSVNRVRNQYIMEFLLKLPPQQAIITAAKAQLMQGIIDLKFQAALKRTTVVVNVDPV